MALKIKSQEKHKETQKAARGAAGIRQQEPISVRGRIFEGFVTKKFPTRVVVEFERTAYVPKYQRFYKKRTRLHARLPHALEVNVGDYIRIQECRPLSKIIRFVVIEKVRSAKTESAVNVQTSAEVKA